MLRAEALRDAPEEMSDNDGKILRQCHWKMTGPPADIRAGAVHYRVGRLYNSSRSEPHVAIPASQRYPLERRSL